LIDILAENEKIKQEKDAQYKVLTQKIIKLQNKLIKTNSLTTKSFNSLNKLLMERSYTNQSHNTNSLNTINNNCLQICNVGKEDILNVLTEQQKKQILNARHTDRRTFLTTFRKGCSKCTLDRNSLLAGLLWRAILDVFFVSICCIRNWLTIYADNK
jgi:hypothetical protein